MDNLIDAPVLYRFFSSDNFVPHFLTQLTFLWVATRLYDLPLLHGKGTMVFANPWALVNRSLTPFQRVVNPGRCQLRINSVFGDGPAIQPSQRPPGNNVTNISAAFS